MIKKTVTYTDFNGISQTEDYFFNLSESDLMSLNSKFAPEFESFQEAVQHATETRNTPLLAKIFGMIVGAAYGEKSEDGKYFEKSEAMTNRFMCSAAYDELYSELCSNEEAAMAFIRGAMPTRLVNELDKNPNVMKALNQ